MNRKEMLITSDSDGLQISVAMIIPKGNIKGIFQISHGMAEHKERYYGFMEYLASQGYVSIIHDHRGHGKSVKVQEDLGYFYDDRANFIVEDLHQIILYVKDLYPGKELILFGHSMGSMVVRKYLKKYDKDIDKLIVCGSPSKNSFASFAIAFTNFMKIFKGDHYRSQFIQNLAFGTYNKNLKDVTSVNSWICANPEVVKQYDNDEYCGFLFTLNGFLNLFKLMKEIYEKDGYQLKHKHLPILFIAGSDDPVIVSEKKWYESQDFLKKLGYTNVIGILYPNMRHEILNEENTDIIYSDIINFVKEK